MTMTAVRYPIAPTTTPRTGTLLDAATVKDGIAWLDGVDMFDSYNCLKFQAAANFCAPSPKTFDQVSAWQDGFRFAAYGGIKCRAVGLDVDRLKTEVTRVFESGESVAVERGLMKTRFRVNDNTATTPGDWPAPTDITPAGGALAPASALATLEGHAAANYVGMPTIHMPVAVASLLTQNGQIHYDGKKLFTALGSKVAAGGGYDYPNTGPDGSNAAAGERWLYATGEVMVQRGPVEIHQVMAYQDNDLYALAERGYVAAVDCYVAAVKVKV